MSVCVCVWMNRRVDGWMSGWLVKLAGTGGMDSRASIVKSVRC